MTDDVYIKESLVDGKIVSYSFVSTGSEAAEKWYTEIVNLFSSWDNRIPLLLLVDLCQANNLLSAEMMKTAREASRERPDVPGKTAVVVDSHESSLNVKALLDHVLAETRPRRLFSNHDEAIAWLLES
jgi:hypothetical protein